MNKQATSLPVGHFWLAVLILLTIGYRLFVAGFDGMSLSNTTPLMAVCFGGGLLLGARFALVPPVLLVISDLALGAYAGTGPGWYTLLTSVVYVLAALAGAWVGRRDELRENWFAMLFGTLGFSILFYLVANTFSWMLAPQYYPQSLAGWWQSQTIGTGLPGLPPSTFFLRNALIGDTVWCLLAAPLFFFKSIRLSSVKSAVA